MALQLRSLAAAQAAHSANLVRVGWLSRTSAEWRMVATFLTERGPRTHSPACTYVHAVEWHVRWPHTHLGVGDLVLTDGRRNFVVVEAKCRGTPARRHHVAAQARRYSAHFADRVASGREGDAGGTEGSIEAATLVDGLMDCVNIRPATAAAHAARPDRAATSTSPDCSRGIRRSRHAA
jgi:hypothetical protein